MSVFVIILNWNGKNDTLECLESLENVPTPHHTIVVDNGSTDQSPQAIRSQFPAVTVLENQENLGYAEGNNVGIRYALEKGAKHLLILNNDTTVSPHFLDAFLQTLKDHPEVAILGSKPLLYSDPTRLDHLGGMWNPCTATFDLIGNREDATKWTTLKPLDYVCGCALFAKAEVFHQIGGFEPRFFLFWEESDWCFRARKAGYASFFCPEATLKHKVSASFTGGKTHTTYFWWRNRLFWIQRNCSKKEKRRLYFRVLLPEMLKTFKLYLIKSVQLFFLRHFKPADNQEEREKRLLGYRAALTGIKDYCFRRFGNGPSWIFQFGTKSPKCYKL